MEEDSSTARTKRRWARVSGVNSDSARERGRMTSENVEIRTAKLVLPS